MLLGNLRRNARACEDPAWTESTSPDSSTAKAVGGQRETMRRGAIRWRTHHCTVTASRVLWTQSRDRGACG